MTVARLAPIIALTSPPGEKQWGKVLVVTREMSFVRYAADEVSFMDRSSIVESSAPDRLLTAPQEERSRMLLS